MPKNMITIALIAILSIALLAVLYLKFQNPENNSPAGTDSNTATANINGKTYNLEIASTPAEREQGLMNRSSLAPDAGMLFVFDGTSFYPFWMKNTYIPLDIIWLNAQKEVVYIKENAQPCSNAVEAVCQSIVPTRRALYVIELNAGEVEKQGLEVGDKVEFELPEANIEVESN